LHFVHKRFVLYLNLVFSETVNFKNTNLRLLDKEKAVEGVLWLRKDQLRTLVLLTQGLGAVFFAVFWSAYFLALPSTNVLSGEPIFKLLLSVFSGLFLLLTIALVLYSAVVNRGKSKTE
jgi:RsiW-degrading membrane proteinase PrsW (M82 family)